MAADDDLQSLIVTGISQFQWGNYGLDNVDPNAAGATWPTDLAENIVAMIFAAGGEASQGGDDQGGIE